MSYLQKNTLISYVNDYGMALTATPIESTTLFSYVDFGIFVNISVYMREAFSPEISYIAFLYRFSLPHLMTKMSTVTSVGIENTDKPRDNMFSSLLCSYMTVTFPVFVTSKTIPKFP